MNSFEEQDYSSEKFSAGIWKKIFKVVLKRKKHLILMIIFVVGLACMDIVYPLLNKYAIDQFFTKKDFSTVKLFVIGYIAIAIGYGVTVWGFIKMAGVVEARVGYEIRSEAFNNLQKLACFVSKLKCKTFKICIFVYKVALNFTRFNKMLDTNKSI